MLKFFEISNRGLADFNNIRLIGLSTKRDKNLIGQFGSGSKYAFAQLARMNLFPTIFIGKDKKIQLSLKDDEIIYSIYQLESDSIDPWKLIEKINSNIHKDFGIIDWKDPWFSIRDLICNAIDEGDHQYGFSEKQKIEDLQGQSDRTTVFIPINSKIISVIASLDERFCFNDTENRRFWFQVTKSRNGDTPEYLQSLGKAEYLGVRNHHLDNGVKVFRNIGTSRSAIYKKGVFVQYWGGPFSYDLSELRLNESRTCESGIINGTIKEFFKCSNDEMIEYFTILFKIAKAKQEQSLDDNSIVLPHEFMVPCTPWDNVPSEYISKGFLNVYGPNAVYVGANNFDHNLAIKQGKLPIGMICHAWNGFLCEVLPSVKKSTFDNAKMEFVNKDDVDFTTAERIINEYCKYLDIPKPTILYFKDKSELKGQTDLETLTIALNRDYISNNNDFRITVIEELLHLKSKKSDGREFQDVILGLLIKAIDLSV